jgi:hypothetical protein
MSYNDERCKSRDFDPTQDSSHRGGYHVPGVKLYLHRLPIENRVSLFHINESRSFGQEERVPRSYACIRSSAFCPSSNFCSAFTSSLRGATPVVAAIAAAHPEAWPMAIAGAIDRAD